MESLETRLSALERQTRYLKIYAGIASTALLLTLYGFHSAQVQDEVRTKKLQIVDDQNVPLITLEGGRMGGGSIVIRDSTGERRAWLTAEQNAAQLGMVSGDPESPTASVGLDVAPNHAHLGVLGAKASSSISARRSPRKPFGLPGGEAYLSNRPTRI